LKSSSPRRWPNAIVSACVILSDEYPLPPSGEPAFSSSYIHIQDFSVLIMTGSGVIYRYHIKGNDLLTNPYIKTVIGKEKKGFFFCNIEFLPFLGGIENIVGDLKHPPLKRFQSLFLNL
jgi:hypothetical protein